MLSKRRKEYNSHSQGEISSHNLLLILKDIGARHFKLLLKIKIKKIVDSSEARMAQGYLI